MKDGEKLKQRLLELGMKKTEFARRLGTSSQNIYIMFKTKEINRKRRKQIEEILDFKFDREELTNYQIEYYNLLKKYTEALEKIEFLNSKCNDNEINTLQKVN